MLHTRLPTSYDVEKLAAIRATPALSIYLRTTPVTQEAKSDRIELKNLLKTALDEMTSANIDKRKIEPIQEHVNELIDDDEFWATQANSLAIFATSDRIFTYQLGNHVTNLVEVSDRFHLKPLLRAVTFPHNAYVLAVSMGAVRLIEVTPDSAPREITVPGLPKNMADALGRRSHLERSGDMSKAGESSENALLTRYSRSIDKVLHTALLGRHRPLIIAAAEPLASVFRHVSSYHNVADDVIAGSADHTPDHELASAARVVLDRIYAGEMAAFAEMYAQREQQGRATADIAQAARAATFGAIDTLLVDMDVTISGFINDDGVVIFDEAPNALNYGIIDEIARRTMQAGGKVIAGRRSDIPGNAELAAVLRYAF